MSLKCKHASRKGKSTVCLADSLVLRKMKEFFRPTSSSKETLLQKCLEGNPIKEIGPKDTIRSNFLSVVIYNITKDSMVSKLYNASDKYCLL